MPKLIINNKLLQVHTKTKSFWFFTEKFLHHIYIKIYGIKISQIIAIQNKTNNIILITYKMPLLLMKYFN